ncbi:anhydro-N-acetylmuramic acid kinase [Antarcticibacterium sp. 1MA-6-2]|uniref:anhydro-N-acetylmuramic acid kinase n=1 Tax=Antarcticibacterium sp. 1MA-6-2 TaxID=2908210 RepID=UPI001F2337CC|nr:anhydro-N-acetylmuramic acid kinase [Antarcticibacterium sp. 1MA-6-2]UJH89783.1 anhydro-N-acetylmuramic acid kinase [Antarcticibacterium sp. 1MA-6-2]
MKKFSYKVLGVMSGTSLDGIDLAVVNFTKEDSWKFEIEDAETIPYPVEWKDQLSRAIEYGEDLLNNLNEEYTRYLASIISTYLKKRSIYGLDAICSHGHTIKHEPQNMYTLQIGNLPLLAQLLQHKIVCDFRVQDVQLGGQGAPLVPIGDQLLFSQYKYCLNLGGFANISTERGNSRIAYDVAPVNTVLNYYAEKLGHFYDAGGQIASSGKLIDDLFIQLGALPFYNQDPPKSLGIEWVNAEILPLLRNYESDVPSILNTFCQHVASQITRVLDNSEDSEILITGGGSYNTFLLQQIKARTKNRIIVPTDEIVNFKEALIFGLLGVLKLRGEINVLSSVTGAERDHSSGVIFEP